MADDIGDEDFDDDLPEEGEAQLPAVQGGYQVGYKKPPRNTQFKPGQSGNPRGRKKGSRGLKTDLNAELNRVLEVKMGGYHFKGTTQQLMLRALTLLAANGNLTASAQLLPLILTVFGSEDRGADKRKLSPQDQLAFDNFFTAFCGEFVADEDEADSGANDPDANAGGGGNNNTEPPPAAAAADEPERE